MFLKIEDFTAEWTSELRLTGQVMQALTDDALSQAVRQDRRTLGQIAWHLVSSIHYMTYCGLEFEGLADGEQCPDSAAVIADSYSNIGRSMLKAVQTQWSDETLQASQAIMGVEWKNGATLRFVLMHQAHHRGQMTVLMRQAGLRLPEVYGPTYEDWVDKGMEPLA
jgi:uncharacterized damage-inducible protein DinB